MYLIRISYCFFIYLSQKLNQTTQVVLSFYFVYVYRIVLGVYLYWVIDNKSSVLIICPCGLLVFYSSQQLHILGYIKMFIAQYGHQLLCDAHAVPRTNIGELQLFSFLLTIVLFCFFFCVFVSLDNSVSYSGVPR